MVRYKDQPAGADGFPDFLQIPGLTRAGLTTTDTFITAVSETSDGRYDISTNYAAGFRTFNEFVDYWEIGADSDVDPVADWQAKADPTAWRLQVEVIFHTTFDNIAGDPRVSVWLVNANDSCLGTALYPRASFPHLAVRMFISQGAVDGGAGAGTTLADRAIVEFQPAPTAPSTWHANSLDSSSALVLGAGMDLPGAAAAQLLTSDIGDAGLTLRIGMHNYKTGGTGTSSTPLDLELRYRIVPWRT